MNRMRGRRLKTVYIVGAGFSSYAGLPLTNGFTRAMLAARDFKSGPSKLIVDYVSRFIHDCFGHSLNASAGKWPDLEDVFTCVDLSANSGHHLGHAFAPADLRTVRRVILSRIVRMLDQAYETGRKGKSPAWRLMDSFFSSINPNEVGFISMNWDNVLERKLQNLLGAPLIDYGCDALAAGIPDLPDSDDFRAHKAYLKALRKPPTISLGKPLSDADNDKRVPLVKIHGSINWLYCDNCRRLYWLHPDQVIRIADQLITEDDLRRIVKTLGRAGGSKQSTIDRLKDKPRILCSCSEGVPLGARIATFSYRKALDFPMFQKSWFAAEELLRNAEEWVFIGYSLPSADFEFKYLLKRMQLSHSSSLSVKVVSGGDSKSVKRTLDNYKKFFGRCIKDSTFFGGGLQSYLSPPASKASSPKI
jgi:hypothetical protein